MAIFYIEFDSNTRVFRRGQEIPSFPHTDLNAANNRLFWNEDAKKLCYLTVGQDDNGDPAYIGIHIYRQSLPTASLEYAYTTWTGDPYYPLTPGLRIGNLALNYGSAPLTNIVFAGDCFIRSYIDIEANAYPRLTNCSLGVMNRSEDPLERLKDVRPGDPDVLPSATTEGKIEFKTSFEAENTAFSKAVTIDDKTLVIKDSFIGPNQINTIMPPKTKLIRLDYTTYPKQNSIVQGSCLGNGNTGTTGYLGAGRLEYKSLEIYNSIINCFEIVINKLFVANSEIDCLDLSADTYLTNVNMKGISFHGHDSPTLMMYNDQKPTTKSGSLSIDNYGRIHYLFKNVTFEDVPIKFEWAYASYSPEPCEPYLDAGVPANENGDEGVATQLFYMENRTIGPSYPTESGERWSFQNGTWILFYPKFKVRWGKPSCWGVPTNPIEKDLWDKPFVPAQQSGANPFIPSKRFTYYKLFGGEPVNAPVKVYYTNARGMTPLDPGKGGKNACD